MPTVSNIFGGIDGKLFVEDPALAFTRILEVKRGGIEHDIIYSGTPNTRQVLYDGTRGRLTFIIPFVAGVSLTGMEPIYVMYNS